MKTNKKRIGDVGIRLKPNDPNILENYIKFRKITRKKKKKKRKRKKKTVKSIEIHHKKDPLLQIIEESKGKEKNEISITDDKSEKPDKSEKSDKSDKPDKSDKIDDIKKVKVQNRPHDLSEKDPNVKKLVITTSIEPDKKKKGSKIKLE
tara:strand:- start:418 stop:864 length:447 start_codon:yes stop_codon:yes gene_type:complete